MMVQEIEGGRGTRIVYDSAISTMVVDDNEELKTRRLSRNAVQEAAAALCDDDLKDVGGDARLQFQHQRGGMATM